MSAGPPSLPTSPRFSARGGGEPAGFAILVERERPLLRTRAWGLWSVEVAHAYRAAMFAAFETLRGAPWALLSDRRKSPPQRQDVQAVMVDVMRQATALGRVRAAVLVAGATSQMQMQRLANQNQVTQRLFEHEPDAVQWALQPFPAEARPPFPSLRGHR